MGLVQIKSKHSPLGQVDCLILVTQHVNNEGEHYGLLTHDVVVDVAVALVRIEARPVAEQQIGGVVADLVGAVGDRAQDVLDQAALQAQQTLEELHVEHYRLVVRE